ncbi:MAG: asparagine synthetase B, partial [Chloroflexi bacterium]|nr:asparagine synthetase B [Chloroflexota bacterium]
SRALRFARALGLPPHERYTTLVGIFDRAQLLDLLDPAFERSTAHADDAEAANAELFRALDPVSAASELDRRTYLPDDLLVKADIASMATSLELRSPFLDTAVVEFGIRLPAALKVRGLRGKRILRRALAGLIPAENLGRAKQGFGVPIGAWFRGDLGAYARDVILSTAARQRGYFRGERVERLLREHATGAADHTHRVWSLLMLELWHREMVDVHAAATAA